jgi:hypothetical protein
MSGKSHLGSPHPSAAIMTTNLKANIQWNYRLLCVLCAFAVIG